MVVLASPGLAFTSGASTGEMQAAEFQQASGPGRVHWSRLEDLQPQIALGAAPRRIWLRRHADDGE